MLIDIIILVLLAVLAYWAITKFIVIEPLKTIFLVVVGVIIIFALLRIFGIDLGGSELLN